MTIYLMVKTHTKTGLKYLCKTSQDPYIYKGSGVTWTSHLKEHGRNISTEIIKECRDQEELKTWGRYYSELWNVVESSEWANRIPETGGGSGGATTTGKTTVKDPITGLVVGCLPLDDTRVINKEVVGVAAGTVTVKDKDGNNLRVKTTDASYINGDLVPVNVGMSIMKTVDGEVIRVRNDVDRSLFGLVGHTKGKARAKDPLTGKKLGLVPLSDPRWVTNEIVGQNTGNKTKTSKCKFCDKEIGGGNIHKHEKACERLSHTQPPQ